MHKGLSGWSDAIEQGARAAVRSADVGPAKPPTNLTGAALDLWLVEQEIIETRQELFRMRQQARLGGPIQGIAALGKRFDELIARRAELRPPAPPTQDDEERRWRADADLVLRLIEQGVTAAEAEPEVPSP